MIKIRDYTALFSVLPLLTWGGFAIVVVYALNWFEACGLSGSIFGTVMSAVCVAAFLCQLGLGELISRVPSLTLKAALMGLGGLLLGVSALLSLAPKLPTTPAVLLFALMATGVIIIPSLVNALGVAAPQSGYPVNYGVARSVGALGFAAASYLTGWLVNRFGAEVIPRLYCAVSLLLILGAWAFPAIEKPVREKRGSGAPLWRDLRFLLFLAGVVLVYISQNLLSNYMLKIVQRIGGNAQMQGVIIAIAAACELPAMFLFTRFCRLGRCDSWLKLSAAFLLLRNLGCLFANGSGALYAVQLLQLMGYGLFCVSSVAYVDAVVGKSDSVRGQSMLAATSTLSSFLVYCFGGVLLDRLGIAALTLAGSAAVGIGLMIFALTLKRVRI